MGMVGEVGDYRPWYRFDPSMTGVAVVSISDGWLTVPHSVNAGFYDNGNYVVVYGSRWSSSEMLIEVAFRDSYGSIAGESYSLDTSCTSELPCGEYWADTIAAWGRVFLPFSAAQHFTLFSLCI